MSGSTEHARSNGERSANGSSAASETVSESERKRLKAEKKERKRKEREAEAKQSEKESKAAPSVSSSSDRPEKSKEKPSEEKKDVPVKLGIYGLPVVESPDEIPEDSTYVHTFRGVSRHTGNFYEARIQVNRKNIFIGCFSTAEDAARAYDRASVEFRGPDAPRNFDDEGNRINSHSTAYRGVTHDKKRDKYKAYIRVDGKMRHLGVFESATKAALAYDAAARQYHGVKARVNFVTPPPPAPPQE